MNYVIQVKSHFKYTTNKIKPVWVTFQVILLFLIKASHNYQPNSLEAQFN